jgi:hypothetical protein
MSDSVRRDLPTHDKYGNEFTVRPVYTGSRGSMKFGFYAGGRYFSVFITKAYKAKNDQHTNWATVTMSNGKRGMGGGGARGGKGGFFA